MLTKFFPIFAVTRVTLLVGMALTMAARAADQTWDPNGPTDYWSTASEDTNWDAGAVWTQGNNAIFDGFYGEYVWLNTGISVGNITFNAAEYMIFGDTLTLASGSTINTGDYNATISSIIAGSPGITKSGSGTLTLSGANTFSGGTTITGGTLIQDVTRAGTINTGAVTVNTGTVYELLSGSNTGADTTLFQNNVYSGTGTIRKTGSGYIGIAHAGSNTNGFNGTYDILAGTLGFNSGTQGSGNATFQLNGATTKLDVRTGTVKIDALTGVVGSQVYISHNAGGTLSLGNNNGSGTFNGSLSNVGSSLTLIKNGSGSQILSGANITHAGSTTVNDGTLVLQNTTGWNSNISLAASNTPAVQLDAPLATDAWAFSKPISGGYAAAKVEKVGAGSVSLPVSQTYTAPTVVSAGKLMLASPVYGTAMPAIPGMSVWLDAADTDGNNAVDTSNGAAISTWKNKGTLGAAADFTATTTGTNNPTYTASVVEFNNKPTVKFLAADKMLANTYNFGNTVSVVYIGRIGTSKFRLVSGGTVNWILGYHGGNMGANWWNGGTLGTTADMNPHIWINGATGGANAKGYRFDAAGETALGDGTGGAGPTAGLTLGGRWVDSERSDGDIAELFVFDHQLTTTERQQLEGYLYNKYFGSPFNLVVGLNAASPVSVVSNATFGGNGSAGNITVAAGGTLEGGNNGAGKLTASNLTFSGAGTVRGTLAAGVAPVVVTGALTTSGGVNSVSVAPANFPANGTYHILQFGTYSPLIDNFKFAEPQRSMVLQKTPPYIDVVVASSPNYPVWTGVGSGEWNFTTGLGNWKLSSDSSPTDFMAFDNALFNDTATGTTSLVVGQSNISAGNFTFNNSSKDYTLTQANDKDITAGNLVKTGSGKLTISGSFTFPGGSSLGGGIVSINSLTSLGTGGRTLNGSTLEYTGATGTLGGNTTLSSGSTINIVSAAAVVTHAGAFSGTGALTKAGAGSLVISGTNTSNGATTINAGTLVFSGNAFFNIGRSTTIASGAVLELANSNNTFTTQMPVSSINGSGTFRLSGNTTIDQSTGGAPGNRLIMNMTGGMIELNDTAMFKNGGWQEVDWTNNKSSMSIASGARLDIWDGKLVIIDGLNGAGTVDKNQSTSSATIGVNVGVNNGDGNFTGILKNTSGTLTFTKSGSGIQTLSGAGITYTGATTVNSGTLKLVDTTGFASAVTMNGGTLELNRFSASWNFPNLIAAGSGAGNVKIAALFGGAVTLSGTNTYTGTTIIESGNLTVTGSIAASPLIDLLYAGILSNSTVGNGQTLRGIGQLNNVTFGSGSTLTPGAADTIGTIDGSGFIKMQAGSTCVMQVNRTGTGTVPSDRLSGVDDLTYGGTLTVTATGSAFTAGNIVSLFPAASVYRGSFSTINLPTLTPSTLRWDISDLTVNGSIRVVSTLARPIFNPPAGGYLGAQSISISAEAGSTIYYTTDGSTPTTSSPNGLSPVTGVIVPSASTVTIKAFAQKIGTPTLTSLVGSSTYNTLDSAVWRIDYNGSWSVASNWKFNAIPQGSGASADFSTLSTSLLNTVSLDAPRTLGRLIFGDMTDQFGWAIIPGVGGSLLLDNGANPPVIDVKNQSATISAVTTSTTGLYVTSTIYTDFPLNGGTGKLILSAANNISGPVTIAAGTLEVGNLTSISSSSAITLGSDEATNPTLSLAGGGNIPIASLTVAPNCSGATFLTNQWAPVVNGTTTLHSALTFKGVSTGAWNGAIFKTKIIGNGAGAGNDSLILDANGQTATANAFVWEYSVADANEFIGNVRVKGGTTNAQNRGTNWNNVAFPDAAMLTIETGSTFRWNNTNGQHVLETLDGLAGGGILDRAVAGANSTLTINAGNAANDGDRNFSGSLVGFTTSLTKTGAGTQTFSGTGITYTNATTINGGTLELSGTTAFASAVTVNAPGTLLVNNVTGTGTGTAAITVKSGATIGGAGRVATPTIEAGGIIAPGNVGIGTLTATSIGLPGTSQVQIQVGASTCDLFAVTGTLTTTGTPSIAITTVGTPTAASYTIATYGSLSGSLPTVTGLPSGYTLDTSTTGQIKLLQTATPFSTWADSWTSPALSDKTPGGDPDHDGIANLMEYVIGGDPRVSSTQFLPTHKIEGSNLVISYKRNDASEGNTSQTGQWSASLGSWTDVPPALINENGALPDDMTVTIPLSNAAGGGKLFGRIIVTQP